MKIAELDYGETVKFRREAEQRDINAHDARMVRFENGCVGADRKGTGGGRDLQKTASGGGSRGQSV